MDDRPKRVLVTRPDPGSRHTSAALRDAGYEPVAIPFFAIEPAPSLVSDLTALADTKFAGLVFTSANAPRILTSSVGEDLTAPFKGLPAYAVGEATAEAARAAGFSDVITAPADSQNDAVALAAFLAQTLSQERGLLLHFHGRARAADLSTLLEGTGWDILACLTYLSVPVEGREESVRTAQQVRSIDAVLHFSPRAARHYGQISGAIEPIRSHACLSPAVADALLASMGENLARESVVLTAPVPTQRELLQALMRACV
jgi:uroporphyrinogen-III synthase